MYKREKEEERKKAAPKLSLSKASDTGSIDDLVSKVHESGKFKRAFFWLCGIKQMNDAPKYTIDTSIAQDPFWKNVCDVNAVIAMALCGFCYGFFNKFTD